MTTQKRDIIDLYAEKIARDEQEMAEEEQMLRLLAGYRAGGLTAKFPIKGSDDERAARSTLARYVNRKMPGFAGHLLALAIDPAMEPHPGMRRTCVVEFRSPNRGKKIEWARHLAIVSEVRKELRVASNNLRPGQRIKLDPILETVGKRFRINRAAVYKIWMKNPEGQWWAPYFKKKTN